MGLFSSAEVGQAKNAYNQAVDTSGMLQSGASTIGSTLTPFLTEEMLHPQGYGQQGLSAMTAAAEGGAGGATSGLTGQAMQRAAASHNAGGYQAALDAAARERTKATAGASEGIAANNAGLQQQQMQEGAKGLQGMYNTDTSGMLNAMNQEHGDLETELAAAKQGPDWMNTLNDWYTTMGNGAKAAGSMAMAGG